MQETHPPRHARRRNPTGPIVNWRCNGLALVLALLAGNADGFSDWSAPGLYAIESQTMMPHLDEMRRISKIEQRCVGADETEAFFPVLRQAALRGCGLAPASRDGVSDSFVLQCETDMVATGTARLWSARGRVRGKLDIKMGGKNMTFSQHIDALRLSDCGSVGSLDAGD